MTTGIPDYVVSRIRQTSPSNSYIVTNSTPVIAFGDFQNSEVATLGLNPSRREFLDDSGNPLQESKRRLASSSDTVDQVFSGCIAYFDGNNPNLWFNKFKPILARFKVTYSDRSACHLDLVQWATDPTWGRLPKDVKNRLIETDGEFLRLQITKHKNRLILVNGRSVWKQIRQLLGNDLQIIEELQVDDGPAYRPCMVYSAKGPGCLQFVAWSSNLQSSHGVSNDFLEELADLVKSLAHRGA